MADHVVADQNRARKSVALECLHSVLWEIADAAVESEVSGVLLGTRDETRIRILSFRRLVPKRAFGRSGGLSEEDLDAVARLIGGPPVDGELYGLEPVGWFRAQPRRHLAASGTELELLNTLFTEEHQVGMFFRPGSAGPARARFYIRERDGFLPDGYRELIVPVAVSDPMLTVTAEPTRPELPHQPPAPDLELLSRRLGNIPLDLPEEEPQSFSQQAHGWVWRAASSLGICVLVLGYWWWSTLRQQSVPPAAPRQPDVLAESDRHLPPVGDAIELPATVREEPGPAPIDQPPLPEQKFADLPKQPPVKIAPAEPPPDTKQSRDTQSSRDTQPPRNVALRPLHLPPAPPKPAPKVADLALAPAVTRETAPPTVLPLPQSITILPPPKKAAAPAMAAVPSKGTLIWTGRLRKNGTLIIDGKTASAGSLTGELPGRPVQFTVYPGDLGDNGILVFTDRAQDARIGWDAPGPQNGWNRIMYEFDPRHAAGIEIAEAPSPQNAWKRLVLRCTNPKLSVVYVKWSLAR